MKILLTGAAGFIGGAFLRLALARGHEAAALASPGKTPPEDLRDARNLTWLRGTLADAPWREIAAFRPDICLHAAWIATPGVYLESPENVRFLEESIVFLRQAREAGARHIVGLGTCIEYKIGREILSEERTPIVPETLYARCKNDLRIALEKDAAKEGFSFCWGRVFYPYGPGEHPARLCSSIIKKLSRGEKIILKTPDSTKDYIYIEDLAGALAAIVERKFSGAINLGTGTGVAVREIAGTIGDLMGKTGLIEQAPAWEPDPLGFVVADAGRLKSLGWKQLRTLREGLEGMVRRRVME